MITIAETQARLARGETTAVALAEEAIARALYPAGEGARVFTAVRAEAALKLAAASDACRAAGLVRSPLEGVPVSIKDLFDVAGEVTRAGSVVLADAAPAERHATAVERLIGAGAVVVGRTTMTEFAFSGLGLNPHHGTPANPYDRAARRIPGGSSSGAAVSVTDGMAVAALGTDTGGSVRIPAALCGLVGFKPTARRVPRAGTLPLSTSLDSIGPLAAGVACAAVMDAVLSGEPHLPPPAPADLVGLRLAVPRTVVLDGLDPAVADAFERSLVALRAAGAHLAEIDLPEFVELAAINAKGGLAAAEAWHWHRHLIERAGDRYDPRVKVRIERGRVMTAADYLDVLAARAAWIAAVEKRLEAYDAFVMPTVAILAPTIAALAADDDAYTRANILVLRNPTFVNMLDGCAATVPCHRDGEAPVGFTVAGTAGRDRRVLAIAEAVARVLPA